MDFLGRAAASRNGDGAGAGAGGAVSSFGEHDRILSRRDLVDGLKNPEKYCATGGKFFFHFSTQKIQKGSKTVK